MNYDRDAWVELDKAKLINNYNEVARLVGPDVKICAVLKGQGVGMDAKMALALYEEQEHKPHMYAVAIMSEALELREVTDRDILILGYVSEYGYETAIKNDITLSIYREDAFRALIKKAEEMGKKAICHVVINSGMNRIGFNPTDENADIIAELMASPHVDVRGIFTHIATADEPDKSRAFMQKDRFDAFLDKLKARGVTLPIIHAGASPSICEIPEVYYDMVRPGVMLTGNCEVNPEFDHGKVHLENAVKLKGRLGHVLDIKKGEGVSYNFTYIAPEDMTVGIMPLGHTDGFTRIFANDFFITIRGHRAPVIGTVCQDHCVLDLRNVPDPVFGEEIVIYGDGSTTGRPEDGGDGTGDGAMSVTEVAEKRGTIVDEVLVNLSTRRLPRHLV